MSHNESKIRSDTIELYNTYPENSNESLIKQLLVLADKMSEEHSSSEISDSFKLATMYVCSVQITESEKDFGNVDDLK